MIALPPMSTQRYWHQSAINKGKKHRSTELEGIGLEKNMRSMSISAGRNEELVSDSID